mgnify:CR=1 FL=1
MSFDLGKSNLTKLSSVGCEFELVVPEVSEATGIMMKVRGEKSAEVQAFAKRMYNQIQFKEAAAKRKGKPVEPMSLDEAEDYAVEAAMVRLIGWTNMKEDGVEVPYNKENAERILREHPWIRDCIIEEAQNLGNFYKS